MVMPVVRLGPCCGPWLLLLVRENDQAEGAPSAAVVALANDTARGLVRMAETETTQRQSGFG